MVKEALYIVGGVFALYLLISAIEAVDLWVYQRRGKKQVKEHEKNQVRDMVEKIEKEREE